MVCGQAPGVQFLEVSIQASITFIIPFINAIIEPRLPVLLCATLQCGTIPPFHNTTPSSLRALSPLRCAVTENSIITIIRLRADDLLSTGLLSTGNRMGINGYR